MPEPREFRVFLSAVSSEFETARNEMANDFESRKMLVRIQRSFRQQAGAGKVLPPILAIFSGGSAAQYFALGLECMPGAGGQDFVRAHWSQIEAVAEALLARRDLTPDEVRALLTQ